MFCIPATCLVAFCYYTVQITFIFIDFRVCDFAFAFKTQNASSFGSCQTRFEFLSQFRKVRNAFECFVTQVQTHLPKTKHVWPMKINVICTVLCLCLLFRNYSVVYLPYSLDCLM